jgi:hypothetical protein
MGTEGPFPGGKARPGRLADHSPHLVPRPRMSRSYTSPPKRLRGVQWDSFSYSLMKEEKAYYFVSLLKNKLLQFAADSQKISLRYNYC